MICIAYRARTNTDWYMEYEYKKPLKTKKLFASFSYYKLKAEKYFITMSSAWEARATELAASEKSLTRRS